MYKTLMNTAIALTTLAFATQLAVATEPNNQPTNTSAKTVVQPATPAPFHCEVPCGIYSDQMRFEMMLEDTATIAKAITSLNEIVDGFTEGPPTAKNINQMTRWINTKELHATKTQNVMAQYFMTQRIKSSKDNYAKQLAAAHKVMVCAMKCKQDAAEQTAKDLHAAILDFYRAYEGKEPKFEKDHGHTHPPEKK